MKRDLNAFAQRAFDLLVIGGGITGAGVARDATLRGLRVALVDKGDFASGTSSRSTKLIHGGFRYLEQGGFKLVVEACRERCVLQQIAPHLVKPIAFLLPVYATDSRPLWLMRLGMTLYDLMAAYRNPGRHRTFSPAKTLEQEPALGRDGLRGAVMFYDCQEDDARFCLENIIDAAERGAVAANYCEVAGFETRADSIVAARVRDGISGVEFTIAAKVVVNAAGPWVERVSGWGPDSGEVLRLSPTKGIHLLVPRLTQQFGIFFQARQDRRIIFVIPWLDCSIIGSTDTDYQGDPGEARTEAQDIGYLLDEVRQLMPGIELGESDIIASFAGVRPLLRAAGDPSTRPREHRISRQGKNLLNVAGGKYTTYRPMADEVVRRVYQLLGQNAPPCRTAKVLLPLHRPAPAGERIADIPDVFASDVTHACHFEMAQTLRDVMRRRTPLALSRHGDEAVARRVAALMAPLRGWDDGGTRREVESYLTDRRRGVL